MGRPATDSGKRRIGYCNRKDTDMPYLTETEYSKMMQVQERDDSTINKLLDASEQLLYQLSIDGDVQSAARDLANLIAKAKGQQS